MLYELFGLFVTEILYQFSLFMSDQSEFSTQSGFYRIATMTRMFPSTIFSYSTTTERDACAQVKEAKTG